MNCFEIMNTVMEMQSICSDCNNGCLNCDHFIDCELLDTINVYWKEIEDEDNA